MGGRAGIAGRSAVLRGRVVSGVSLAVPRYLGVSMTTSKKSGSGAKKKTGLYANIHAKQERIANGKRGEDA